MKVWVLTAGEFSSYHIEGVFSTLEKAKEFKARDPRKNYVDMRWNDPEEFELDELMNWERGPTFTVTITYKTGILHIHPNFAEFAHTHKLRHRSDCRLTENWDHSELDVISPISSDHAQKVAIEKRQEWLRSERPVSGGPES